MRDKVCIALHSKFPAESVSERIFKIGKTISPNYKCVMPQAHYFLLELVVVIPKHEKSVNCIYSPSTHMSLFI